MQSNRKDQYNHHYNQWFSQMATRLTLGLLLLAGIPLSAVWANDDDFKGINIIFDAKKGDEGDYIDGSPREIAKDTPFRVVIIHPNNLKREYKRTYEKVEHHTAKPPDFLSKFFVSSPTETSALDPFEVNRLTESKIASGGATASDLLGQNRLHPDFGLPPELVQPFTDYQAAFITLRDTILAKDPAFAKAAAPIRKALLTAMRKSDNAAMRKTATTLIAPLYNESTNGLRSASDAEMFPTPDTSDIPLKGLGTPAKDYTEDDIDTLVTFGKKIPSQAQKEVEALDKAVATFSMARNNLSKAIQEYQASRFLKSKGTSVFTDSSGKPVDQVKSFSEQMKTLAEPQSDSRDLARVFTDNERKILVDEILANKDIIAAAKANAGNKEAQAKAAAALRNTLAKAIEEKDQLVGALREHLAEDDKIATDLIQQKRKYLADLANAFTSYSQAYIALLDTDALPTYDIATPLNHTPGDAIDVTVTVAETDAAPALAAAVDSIVPEFNLPTAPPPTAPINIINNVSGASGASSSSKKSDDGDDPLTKKTITLAIYNRPVTDFTIGPYFTDLRNRNFATDPVSGAGGVGQYVIKQGASDRAGSGLAVLVHEYKTARIGRPAFGLSLGTRVDKLDTFLAGGSLVFGSRNRTIFTIGAAMSKVSVLNGTKVGQIIDQATPDTRQVYKTGLFAAISFALDLK